jgi:hypothetical protein
MKIQAEFSITYFPNALRFEKLKREMAGGREKSRQVAKSETV